MESTDIVWRTDFWETKWIFAIAKLSGYWPYGLSVTAESTPMKYCYRILCLVILIAYGFLVFVFVFNPFNGESLNMSDVFLVFISLCYMVSSTIAVCQSLWNHNTIMKFMRNLNAVDTEVCKNSWHRNQCQ